MGGIFSSDGEEEEEEEPQQGEGKQVHHPRSGEDNNIDLQMPSL